MKYYDCWSTDLKYCNNRLGFAMLLYRARLMTETEKFLSSIGQLTYLTNITCFILPILLLLSPSLTTSFITSKNVLIKDRTFSFFNFLLFPNQQSAPACWFEPAVLLLWRPCHLFLWLLSRTFLLLSSSSNR